MAAAAGIHVGTTCSNLFWQENKFVCTSMVGDVVLHEDFDDNKD